MRRYQKFGVVIIAQILCTTLLAQSMMAFDIQLEKNQQSYSAETIVNLSSDFQEEITSMDVITPPIQIIDSISQCKNFPKRHLFPSSTIDSYLMTFTYLTKPKFDVVAIKKLDVNESSLSPNTKPEEKVPNPFNAGIRRVINPKCHGTATGSVKAKASGGMKPYHFLWSNGNTSSELLNIPKGIYTVTISDALGNIATDIATLTEPAPFQVEVTSNSPTCASDSNGVALFHATGGTPYPYKKSLYTTLWSNAMSNGIMFDLSTNTKISLSSISVHLPGTHLQTISIYLKTGTMIGSEFDSTQWQLISKTQMFGAGIDEESHIQISNSPELNPGLYSLYIYNHQGEINGFQSSLIGDAFNYDHILSVFEGISRDSSSHPFLSTLGTGMSMAGKISYVVNNDNNFTYDNNFLDGQWFQKHFPSGPQQITINDALGCAYIKSFTIPAADSIKISSETIKSPRCSNTNDGEIILQAQPANYEYKSMTTIPFANPAFGSMIHIQSSKPISLKGFDLFLNRSGTVSVFVKSGSYAGSENNTIVWSSLGSYSLNKSINSTTTHLLLASPSILAAGDWSFYIYSTDDLFNQLDSVAFFDNYSMSYINSSSRLGNSGAFTTTHKSGSFWSGNIIYTDANTNLQYNWSNHSILPQLTNLNGGIYQCTILQDNGCSLTKNFSISAPAPVLAKETIQPEVDYDQNGSASLQISGGTPPYYIQWLNTGQIGNQLNQLSEGPQPYFISDAKGCILNDTLYILRTLSPTIGHGSLSIAPSPGHGHVRITKEVHGMEDCELIIIDYAGRLVFKSATKISILMQKGLDMTHYADGNYIIVVRDEDQVFQAKANVTR